MKTESIFMYNIKCAVAKTTGQFVTTDGALTALQGVHHRHLRWIPNSLHRIHIDRG